MRSLQNEGVKTIFGYPGGAIMPVFDALYDYTVGDKHAFKHVLVRHEQGAAHAAEGYARVSGEVGVCLVTSGPGATNTLTGVADAMMDSTPIVVIAGQVGVSALGTDAFQEVDLVGIAQPISKWSYQIRRPEDIAWAVSQAFYIARSGRPGPVVLDFPKNAQVATTEWKPVKVTSVRSYEPYPKLDDDAVARAAALINSAKRPLALVGQGVELGSAHNELIEFLEKADIPAARTLLGLSALPSGHPLNMGMLGMHGSYAPNVKEQECDVLIAIGMRFSDRVTGDTSRFATRAQILQIEIDPAEINKNVIVDHSIIGDVKSVLQELNPRVDEKEHPAWLAEVEALKNRYPLKYDGDRLTGPYVLQELYRITKGEALIVTEVGQNQMWAAQYYKYREPRTFLTSGGLGTMGYGLGASLGAKLGRPDKLVVNVAGDGCFRMNMNEIATAARYNIPVIQLVLNNHVLGMVRQWQTLFYGKRYSATVLNDQVDFVKLAEALGAVGMRVTKREEVAPALEKAIALGRPVVIDCVIDSDDKVFPMMPAGAPLEATFDADDMIKENK